MAPSSPPKFTSLSDDEDAGINSSDDEVEAAPPPSLSPSESHPSADAPKPQRCGEDGPREQVCTEGEMAPCKTAGVGPPNAPPADPPADPPMPPALRRRKLSIGGLKSCTEMSSSQICSKLGRFNGDESQHLISSTRRYCGSSATGGRKPFVIRRRSSSVVPQNPPHLAQQPLLSHPPVVGAGAPLFPTAHVALLPQLLKGTCRVYVSHTSSANEYTSAFESTCPPRGRSCTRDGDLEGENRSVPSIVGLLFRSCMSTGDSTA